MGGISGCIILRHILFVWLVGDTWAEMVGYSVDWQATEDVSRGI
jgi:hypothetical protein